MFAQAQDLNMDAGLRRHDGAGLSPQSSVFSLLSSERLHDGFLYGQVI